MTSSMGTALASILCQFPMCTTAVCLALYQLVASSATPRRRFLLDAEEAQDDSREVRPVGGAGLVPSPVATRRQLVMGPLPVYTNRGRAGKLGGVRKRGGGKVRFDDVSQLRIFKKDDPPCAVAASAGELGFFEHAAARMRHMCTVAYWTNLLEQPGAATVCRRKARVLGQALTLINSQQAGAELLESLETYQPSERRPFFTGEIVGADHPAYKFQLHGWVVTSSGPLMLFTVCYLDAAGNTIRVRSLQVRRNDVFVIIDKIRRHYPEEYWRLEAVPGALPERPVPPSCAWTRLFFPHSTEQLVMTEKELAEVERFLGAALHSEQIALPVLKALGLRPPPPRAVSACMQPSKCAISETETTVVGAAGQGREGQGKQGKEPVLASIKVTTLSHGMEDYDHMAYSLKVCQSFISPSTGAEVKTSTHVVSRRFAQVYALHQTLLRDAATSTAAKALSSLAPRKTLTWSAFLTSDMSLATVGRRMVEIPRYLEAVLNNPKLAAHPAVKAFLGLKQEGTPAY